MKTRLLVPLAAVALGTALTQAPAANAGSSQPAPTCQGVPATLFLPTTENSATSFQGTSGDDVIVTGDGAEFVDGRGGRDLICTRGGPDTIRGGPGDDRVLGGRGADELSGNNGLDRASGGTGTKDVCAAERERRCEANFGD